MGRFIDLVAKNSFSNGSSAQYGSTGKECRLKTAWPVTMATVAGEIHFQ